MKGVRLFFIRFTPLRSSRSKYNTSTINQYLLVLFFLHFTLKLTPKIRFSFMLENKQAVKPLSTDIVLSTGKEPAGTAAATSGVSPSVASQPQGSHSTPGPRNSQSQQRGSALKSDSSQCQGHVSAPSPHTSQSEPRDSIQAPHSNQSRGRDSAARPHSPTNQSQRRDSAPRPQSNQSQPSAKFSNKSSSQLGRKKGSKPTLLEMVSGVTCFSVLLQRVLIFFFHFQEGNKTVHLVC